ncbi:hypothetical protein POJ06DRAFT_299157 [Lipomyces tetrasporus]|uniref:Uncharacterized protein n=1 Tax=Lipomyces tetrasporus TaxID=54092 RepID=A0AAD7QWM1_9ASCO|nr:uncharacterized protein POJ06DRAFT_299157 [Lipomyces tetrasporus]KAJ8102859.1 hypothetical protein POJ06DRAFT_299157 [Lipomyces tetrasporus]
MESEEHSLESLGVLKMLAANDRPTREAGISAFETHLSSSQDISELDFLKVWKGLYYCMWMTDRPKAQQAMASKLPSMLLLAYDDNATKFVKAFWATICREWNNIDRLRVDKFYLLIRRFVHMMFRRLSQSKWERSMVEKWSDILIAYPLNPTNSSIPDGIRYHMIDIYVDELERAVNEFEKTEADKSFTITKSDNDMNRSAGHRIAEIMRPFEILARDGKSKVIKKRAIEEVLHDPRLESRWQYGTPQISPPTDVGNKHSKKKVRIK